MQIRRTAAALTSAAALTLGGVAMAAPASAAPTNQAVGGAAGLVAAVAQIQTGDITVDVVEVRDVNVAVENVLNNNRVIRDIIVQNLLNNNDIDVLNNVTITDVADIAVVDNVIVVSVLS